MSRKSREKEKTMFNWFPTEEEEQLEIELRDIENERIHNPPIERIAKALERIASQLEQNGK